MNTTAAPGTALALDVATIKTEVGAITRIENTDTEADAAQRARALLAAATGGDDARVNAGKEIEAFGRDTARAASAQSRMLQQPIRELAAKGDDGGGVANALVELKNQVEELDPGKFDFEAGWFSRLAGRLPWVGTPVKRYFTRFESAQTVIDAIDRSLAEGRAQLARDNVTLEEDQKAMRALTRALAHESALAQAVDTKLSHALERELAEGESDVRAFVETELVFPLRQRVMDLQQQLAVNQQGVLAIEIIRRNNLELMRGVDRAREVTMSALQVAVTVALALANQKLVLDRVTALNATTGSLIASTAAQLKTQGTEIHRQAASATLNIETLKGAFADINAAIDDIAAYRREALPAMAQTITDLDALGAQAEESIQRMERTRDE